MSVQQPSDMPDLSIVIVSWNTRDLVRQCLASIEASRGELTVETFVVDNASCDGTPAMVQKEFPGVRLMENRSNLGFARANNCAVRLASGKHVCLINSDVTVPPGCLQKLFDYMERNPSAGMAGPSMLTPGGTVGSSCMRRPTLRISLVQALGLGSVFNGSTLHIENLESTGAQDVDVLNGWFWMVRRSALDGVGLLAEDFFMYGEDIDWCHRFWSHGWRVVYLPEASAIHYGGASSSRAPIGCYIEMQRANIQYWRRYHNVVSRGVHVLIVFLHQLLRVFGYGAVYALKPAARSEVSFKIRRSSACLGWLLGLHRKRHAVVMA